MGEENKTRDAIDAVTGLVKAVPVYKDVVQPSAKEVGTVLQKTVHMALAPISGLVWGYEKIEEFVKSSVAKRLEKVPSERIKTPLPQIAGPLLESLKYTGHDENLREIFSKLLATAMDSQTALEAHHSFVEIIRQLSPDEAKICHILKGHGTFAVINLNAIQQDGGVLSLLPLFSHLGFKANCENPKLIQRYLGNLLRLGLIDIEFTSSLDVKFYTDLESSEDLKPYINQIKKKGQTHRFERGVILRTPFGQQFFIACID